MTVINKENGVQRNAHFKVDSLDREFNETSHKFAVNGGHSYNVTNLDTGEIYSVFISDYKDTILNIADGSIETLSYIGDDSNQSDTTGGSNDTAAEISSVPQTGDIILNVLLILGGLTGISLLGYTYFNHKKKGVASYGKDKSKK